MPEIRKKHGFLKEKMAPVDIPPKSNDFKLGYDTMYKYMIDNLMNESLCVMSKTKIQTTDMP